MSYGHVRHFTIATTGKSFDRYFTFNLLYGIAEADLYPGRRLGRKILESFRSRLICTIRTVFSQCFCLVFPLVLCKVVKQKKGRLTDFNNALLSEISAKFLA